METVIVERRFETPAVMDEVQAAGRATAAWCREQYRVTYLHTYLSLDRQTMICIYTAPDADSVRRTQETAGLPVLRAWPGELVIDSGSPAARPGLATVLVERALPQPMPREAVIEMFDRGGHCLDRHRARSLRSYQSLDRTRVLCVFEAPDAESVRIASRQMAAPFERVYSVTFSAR